MNAYRIAVHGMSWRTALPLFLAIALVSACAPRPTDVAALPSPSAPPPAASPEMEQGLVVAYVQDGDILVWDEATAQSRVVLGTGDVIAVTMSDDGQVVAFLRRMAVVRSEMEWYEQSALWAMEPDGENPRELVSAEELRELLGASETESTNIPQMEWIPGTHRLLYSGWTYIVQAEGESHAVPEGLFLVDADSLAEAVLVPAEDNFRFVPSPDGRQVALMSPTELSFVNVDGSDLRQDVLTYPPVGVAGPLFPVGVWTEDSSAFVATGSLELDPLEGVNFTIWRVPTDGSAPGALADIVSDLRSVTFSPDGRHVAAIRFTDEQPPGIAGWFITPLAAEVGPLAIPDEIEHDFASVHWSPAGTAFTRTLMELCPDATSNTEVCDAPISFWGTTAALRWIDGSRVLLLTREPSVLFLVSLDGRSQPIVAWPLEEWVSPQSFTAAIVGR
jgi:hypothetical protein